MRAATQRFDGPDLMFLVSTVVCLVLAALLAGALSNVDGVLAGAFIGLLVSRCYSRRASDQLEEQVDELRKQLEEEVVQLARVMGVLARYMEKDDLLKDVELDARGRLIGWTQTLTDGGIPSRQSVGGGTLVQGPPPAQEGAQESQSGPSRGDGL